MNFKGTKMRKGQAAIDYLTTYGWALVILSVAIAAIYMFLDNKADVPIPDQCSFGDSFNCPDTLINGTSKIITLTLVNAIGTEITLAGLQCTYVGVAVMDKSMEDVKVGPGERFTISCDMSSTNAVFKKKSKFDVSIVYFKKGMSFPSTSDGYVTGSIMK